MKKYNLAYLVVALALTSCLKEDPALDPDESNNVIEIYRQVPTPTASPADAVYPLYIAGFNIQPAAEYKVEIAYAGAGTAPEDIQVVLELDEAAMEAYNDDQGSHYEILPDDMFTVNSWTVTIPRGQRIGAMNVSFHTDQFDLSKAYAFPVKVKSASTGVISKNFGTVIFGIVAKNKWDGIYHMSGTFVDHTLPLATYWGDQEYWLETVDATRVDVYNETLGTYGYLWSNNGGATYYGSFALRLTFDPATNQIVNAVNAYGQPSSNGRSAALNPAGDNRWDEATGNIDIMYYLLQPGTTIRSEFNEHWEYEGPRP